MLQRGDLSLKEMDVGQKRGAMVWVILIITFYYYYVIRT